MRLIGRSSYLKRLRKRVDQVECQCAVSLRADEAGPGQAGADLERLDV